MIDLRYESPDISDLDVLALAAHPHDVEQTCGGTLLKMSEAGYSTGILDLTTGDMSSVGLPEQRLEEAVSAARILKTAWRGNCRFPDARLDNTIAARMTLSTILRTLRPRTLILPYWEARHPDHYRTSELGYEAAFLSGLRKLDEDTPPHRPFKILYSSAYANVAPSFVVEISGAQFERRMDALFAYRSIHGGKESTLRERLAVRARSYGSLIGAAYGEPFVVKETIAIQDIVAMASPTF
jgi:bacillithiol biosynthesis deacetylase BshB1